MIQFVDQWLTPSVYEGNEEAKRDARFINLSLAGLLISCGVVIPIFLLDGVTRFSIVLVAGMGMLSASFFYILLWRGYINTARWGVMSLLYIFVILTNFVNGTVHAPISLVYIFIVTMAGELFGWRGMLASIILCSITVLLLILGENLGILPPPNHTLTLSHWLVYTLVFTCTGAVTHLGNYFLQQALKHAENEVTERKRTETALRISESRFRGLFEQESDAVFIFGLDGRTRDANQRASEMLGYTLEELRDSKGRDFFADNGQQSQNSFERLLAGERIPLLERTLRKKSGDPLPVEISIELIRDEDGKPMHVQSIVRDITQRKQVENALKRANQELQLRVAEIQRLQDELREQAIRDPLTGLFNRRYLDETLSRELVRAEREQVPLSVIVSDIDHFKMINDTYGHPVGDRFLMEVASLMQNHARGSDIVCRYGGEEFIMVLPGTTIEVAVGRSEEIRKNCTKIIIKHEGKDLKMTMSFGVAVYPVHGTSANELIANADKALYRSKGGGRDRVTVFEGQCNESTRLK